jgi:hypothetical protein
MSYDFSTLQDKDLEELAQDILSKKMNINFQSFKMGADQGADLRYAPNNSENEIIVQVKHYLSSGLSKLKSSLKKAELSKVKKLNPKRYILVTSLPLSSKNKEDIINILNPYILSSGDILGKEDLNYFLRANPEIVKVHFKLWLSSTAVLKRILKNGVHGRSEFIDSKIKERIKIFVPNQTHGLSVEILNNKHFILITGAPGIGKTTLADMLTYQLLAENYELVYVTEIREAEEAFETGAKQVFYFNDFLGTITLDLTSSRNVDSAIINFIERVKSDKHKRLILTCRTTILNQAKSESEIINNSKIDISQHEVKIEDYGNLEKAKILYNHIYFSNLSEDLKSVFFKNQFYWKVIKHSNYNPRLVEFFTDIERLQRIVDYDKEVIDFLDKPERIWEKSYSVQISNNARLFLSSMFSLGGRFVIVEEKLKAAFEARLDYEVKNSNYQRKGNVFNKVLQELVGAFVIRTIKSTKSSNQAEYKFFNPSIEDFLYFYFSSKDLDEYFNILKAALFFEQYKNRITTKIENNSKKIYFGDINYKSLLKIYSERLQYLKSYSGNSEIDTVICLIRLFHWNDIKDLVISIMDNLTIASLSWYDRENLIEILDFIAINKLSSSFSFSFVELLNKISLNIPSHFQIDALSKLISKHKIYYDLLDEIKSKNDNYYQEFQDNINKCWEREIDYFISITYNLNEITDKNELIEIVNIRKEEIKQINSSLNIDVSDAIDQYIYDYDAQISKNLSKKNEKETVIENLQNNSSVINESLAVNRLFNSEDNAELMDISFELPF